MNRVEQIMKNLDCSREEALQILEDDKAIEQGKKLFELTDAQKKASKQARGVSRKPSENKTKRERKIDEDKHEIFQVLNNALCDVADNVEVLNQDRELLIFYKDRKFKIVLSCPRK